MMKLLKKWFSKTEEPKEYILYVTTKHPEGGYSSRQYGWSQELVFTYNEALKEKEKLKDNFYEIEIYHISEPI